MADAGNAGSETAPSTAGRRYFIIGLLCGGLLALPLAGRLLHPLVSVVSSPDRVAAPASASPGFQGAPSAVEAKTRAGASVGTSTGTGGGALTRPAVDPSPPIVTPIPVQAVRRVSAHGVIDWSRGQVTASASAAGPRAALWRTLRGLRVDADSRLDDWLLKYPLLSKRIDGLIQTPPMPDSAPPTDTATARLALRGRDGLSALLLAFKLHDGPRTAERDSEPATGADVTLIIDARGLALQPALYPRVITAQGQAVHLLNRVDPNRVAEQGFSRYETSLRSAQRRVPAGHASRVITASALVPGTLTDLIIADDPPARIAMPVILVIDPLGTDDDR